jgi:hypothetical protein
MAIQRKSKMCSVSGCCPYSRKGMKFGLAFGITNAIFMLALGWLGWQFGYGRSVIEQWSTIYHGFGASFWGGVAGAIWGLVIGFIYGYIFGVIVKCVGSCHCKSCKSMSENCK